MLKLGLETNCRKFHHPVVQIPSSIGDGLIIDRRPDFAQEKCEQLPSLKITDLELQLGRQELPEELVTSFSISLES